MSGAEDGDACTDRVNSAASGSDSEDSWVVLADSENGIDDEGAAATGEGQCLSCSECLLLSSGDTLVASSASSLSDAAHSLSEATHSLSGATHSLINSSYSCTGEQQMESGSEFESDPEEPRMDQESDSEDEAGVVHQSVGEFDIVLSSTDQPGISGSPLADSNLSGNTASLTGITASRPGSAEERTGAVVDGEGEVFLSEISAWRGRDFSDLAVTEEGALLVPRAGDVWEPPDVRARSWDYGTDEGSLSVQSLPVLLPGVRQYIHCRNSECNRLLSVLLVLCCVSVLGLGLGHFLGWAHHQEQTGSVVDRLGRKLDSLRSDLLTCLVTEDDPDLDNKWIERLVDENRDLLERLKAAELGGSCRTRLCEPDGEGSEYTRRMVRHLREENRNLRSFISRMQLSHGSDSKVGLTAHSATLNTSVVSPVHKFNGSLMEKNTNVEPRGGKNYWMIDKSDHFSWLSLTSPERNPGSEDFPQSPGRNPGSEDFPQSPGRNPGSEDFPQSPGRNPGSEDFPQSPGRNPGSEDFPQSPGRNPGGEDFTESVAEFSEQEVVSNNNMSVVDLVLGTEKFGGRERQGRAESSYRLLLTDTAREDWHHGTDEPERSLRQVAPLDQTGSSSWAGTPPGRGRDDGKHAHRCSPPLDRESATLLRDNTADARIERFHPFNSGLNPQQAFRGESSVEKVDRGSVSGELSSYPEITLAARIEDEAEDASLFAEVVESFALHADSDLFLFTDDPVSPDRTGGSMLAGVVFSDGKAKSQLNSFSSSADIADFTSTVIADGTSADIVGSTSADIADGTSADIVGSTSVDIADVDGDTVGVAGLQSGQTSGRVGVLEGRADSWSGQEGRGDPWSGQERRGDPWIGQEGALQQQLVGWWKHLWRSSAPAASAAAGNIWRIVQEWYPESGHRSGLLNHMQQLARMVQEGGQELARGAWGEEGRRQLQLVSEQLRAGAAEVAAGWRVAGEHWERMYEGWRGRRCESGNNPTPLDTGGEQVQSISQHSPDLSCNTTPTPCTGQTSKQQSVDKHEQKLNRETVNVGPDERDISSKQRKESENDLREEGGQYKVSGETLGEKLKVAAMKWKKYERKHKREAMKQNSDEFERKQKAKNKRDSNKKLEKTEKVRQERERELRREKHRSKKQKKQQKYESKNERTYFDKKESKKYRKNEGSKRKSKISDKSDFTWVKTNYPMVEEGFGERDEEGSVSDWLKERARHRELVRVSNDLSTSAEDWQAARARGRQEARTAGNSGGLGARTVADSARDNGSLGEGDTGEDSGSLGERAFGDHGGRSFRGKGDRGFDTKNNERVFDDTEDQDREFEGKGVNSVWEDLWRNFDASENVPVSDDGEGWDLNDEDDSDHSDGKRYDSRGYFGFDLDRLQAGLDRHMKRTMRRIEQQMRQMEARLL